MNAALSVRLMPALVVLVAMIVAPMLAEVTRPTQWLVDLEAREKLEDVIPKQFADWKLLPSSGIVQPDPQTAEKLNRIYSELFSETYVNSRGQHIMLSIAYGKDQRDSMAIHYPEVCYPSQGFVTRSNKKIQLTNSFTTTPARQLEMIKGQRFEPVTYWTTIGNHPTLGGIDKKLAEMRYGLKGVIPDGMLFRVSSIDGDSGQAFALHQQFVNDLLEALRPDQRKRFIGL